MSIKGLDDIFRLKFHFRFNFFLIYLKLPFKGGHVFSSAPDIFVSKVLRSVLVNRGKQRPSCPVQCTWIFPSVLQWLLLCLDEGG